MENLDYTSLMHLLAVAKSARPPDMVTIQDLRWTLSCWLADTCFCGPDGQPRATEPTHAETLEVLEHYKLKDDLNHLNLVAAWTFASLEHTVAFMVTAKLPTVTRPTEKDIQMAIGIFADDITADMNDSAPEDRPTLAASLEDARSLTSDTIVNVWMTCMAYGIPPFPNVEATARQ